MMNNNCRVIDHPIVISEGGLTAKNILDADEIMQAYRLRHRIFCQTLGWRPEARNGLEIDNYDIEAVFFGVFNEKNRLLAFLRIILPEKRFMLEYEFIDLVGPDHTIRKECDTVEISRCCV
ncbi:MAG: acyl-homoserine-lactone synthase, partial [bacterium]